MNRSGSSVIVIDCEECVMRNTDACTDCLVTHMCAEEDADPGGTVLNLAEHRAVRWFADAGMVPTLRHRVAANGR